PFRMEECVVERCRAAKGAGGYLGRVPLFLVTDVTFRDNEAFGGLAEGGGLVVAQSAGTLDRCHFERNSAGLGGGLRLNAPWYALITHCAFLNNSARSGAGACGYGGEFEIVNSLFAGNTAEDFGGGLFCSAYAPVSRYGNTFVG